MKRRDFVKTTVAAGAIASFGSGMVSSASIDTEPRKLALTDDISLINIETGEIVWTPDNSDYRYAKFSNDHEKVLLSGSDWVGIFDVLSEEMVWETNIDVTTSDRFFTSCAWSTDESHVYVCDRDGYVFEFDAETGEYTERSVHYSTNAPGTFPNELESHEGLLYISAGNGLAEIDEETFEEERFTSLDGGSGGYIVFDEGNVYTTREDDGYIYSVGKDGGGINWGYFDMPTGNERGSMALDGEHLYTKGERAVLLDKNTGDEVEKKQKLSDEWSNGFSVINDDYMLVTGSGMDTSILVERDTWQPVWMQEGDISHVPNPDPGLEIEDVLNGEANGYTRLGRDTGGENLKFDGEVTHISDKFSTSDVQVRIEVKGPNDDDYRLHNSLAHTRENEGSFSMEFDRFHFIDSGEYEFRFRGRTNVNLIDEEEPDEMYHFSGFTGGEFTVEMDASWTEPPSEIPPKEESHGTVESNTIVSTYSYLTEDEDGEEQEENDRGVVAINVDEEEVSWRQEPPANDDLRGMINFLRRGSEVCIYNGRVYHLNNDGRIHVLDLETGEEIHSDLLLRAYVQEDYGFLGMNWETFMSNLVIYDNIIFVSVRATDTTSGYSDQILSRVMALHVDTFEILWVNFHEYGCGEIYADEEYFFYETGNRTWSDDHPNIVHAVDKETGEEVWAFHSPSERSITPFKELGQNLIFGTDEETVYSVNKYTGDEEWRVDLPLSDYRMSNLTAAYDGEFYVQTPPARVHQLDANTGEIIWRDGYHPRNRFTSSIIGHRGRIYTSQDRGVLLGINRDNGSVDFYVEVDQSSSTINARGDAIFRHISNDIRFYSISGGGLAHVIDADELEPDVDYSLNGSLTFVPEGSNMAEGARQKNRNGSWHSDLPSTAAYDDVDYSETDELDDLVEMEIEDDEEEEEVGELDDSDGWWYDEFGGGDDDQDDSDDSGWFDSGDEDEVSGPCEGRYIRWLDWCIDWL